MSIKYAVVYNDGSAKTKSGEPCFGKLKDFKGNAVWEVWPHEHDHGGLKGIRFHPSLGRCTHENAVAYWEYLLGSKLWADIVIDEGHSVANMISHEGILVSAEARPYHMLNTLSIFRHVQIFNQGVNLFGALVAKGCNKDIAFMVSALLTSNSGEQTINSRTNEDSEHTVICHKTFTPADYKAYLLMSTGDLEPPVSDHDAKVSYSEFLKYTKGGVATWLSGTDDRSEVPSDELLVSMLLPKDYRIRYNKVDKKVELIDSIDSECKLHELAPIVEHLNKLHESIVG